MIQFFTTTFINILHFLIDTLNQNLNDPFVSLTGFNIGNGFLRGMMSSLTQMISEWTEEQ